MPLYSVRDVQRVLQLAPQTTRSLIRAGFVRPARGPRREYRFSFQDLIVLRTARALMAAKIPKKRIRRSLESLKHHLPESMPLSGLAISAVGDHVVVRDGEARWQADSGQYLLGLDVSLKDGVLQVVEHKAEPKKSPAEPAPVRDWFERGLTLEGSDPDGALAAYQQAVASEPQHAAAWTNWGRLLHERGRTAEAEEVYRRGLKRIGSDPMLLFNQGVLFEDLGKSAAALAAYQTALAEDPDLADCHYNLARLYEALGQPQYAIRHLGRYRRLLSGEGR